MIDDTVQSVRSAARQYLAKGYQPIPVPAGMKGPRRRGWNATRFGAEAVDEYFRTPGNIGLLLGEPSGWLVDVDLDGADAVRLAGQFLPPTNAKTGRASKPDSHWWYKCKGAVTQQFKHPATSGMIVEIRSTGVQTLVGPSIHPSGEPYSVLEEEPAEIDPDTLATAVKALADAVAGPKRRSRKQARQTQRESRPLGDEPSVLRRARAYLNNIPGAVSGSGGHSQTYAAATAMVHGFALDPAVAFDLLMREFNPRCVPPWSEAEMMHKVEDAANKPHERPRGWLADARTTPAPLADRTNVSVEAKEPNMQVHADPGPFPEHLLNVPGFISEVMDYNKATAIRWQPVLALAGALALQCVLAGRKVRDEHDNRTNLYCLSIAPSGAGKDNARKVNKRILCAAGLTALEGPEDLASDAGLVAAIAKQPAILFQIDEFGRFLQTIGDPKKAAHLFNVISVLMKFFSSASTVYKGKAYADSSRNRSIIQPCVSLFCTSVPEPFYESLTTASLKDGFMARMLVFESSDRPPRQRVKATVVPQSIIEIAKSWGQRPCPTDAEPAPVLVQTAEEAEVIFEELATSGDVHMEQGDSIASSLWARAEETARRLALVYACSQSHSEPRIDADAAKWACDVATYLIKRMLYQAGQCVADGPFGTAQLRVLRIITDAGEITRSELCRKTQDMTPRERNMILENLEECRRIKREFAQTTTKSKEVYRAL